MKLTRERIVAALTMSLQEAQSNIEGEPEQIGENTIPVGELRQFDSLTTVEVTVHCLAVLGIEDLPPFPSVFISDGGKALSVSEAVDRLQGWIKNLSNEE